MKEYAKDGSHRLPLLVFSSYKLERAMGQRKIDLTALSLLVASGIYITEFYKIDYEQ